MARNSHSISQDADQRGAALNDLGIGLQALGARDSDTVRLEQAVVAYANPLLEWTRETVPMDWAMTQDNLALLQLAFFEKSREAANLERAEDYAMAAQEVYLESGAGFYIDQIAQLLEQINGLREDLSGGST